MKKVNIIICMILVMSPLLLISQNAEASCFRDNCNNYCSNPPPVGYTDEIFIHCHYDCYISDNNVFINKGDVSYTFINVSPMHMYMLQGASWFESTTITYQIQEDGCHILHIDKSFDNCLLFLIILFGILIAILIICTIVKEE